MTYHSVSSAATRDYLVHPYRLAFAQGGLYLLAFVPAYKDIRTFAADRIRSVSLEKQTFVPKENVGDDVFANSLGVNTGPAAKVEIEFEPRVAPFVTTTSSIKFPRKNSIRYRRFSTTRRKRRWMAMCRTLRQLSSFRRRQTAPRGKKLRRASRKWKTKSRSAAPSARFAATFRLFGPSPAYISVYCAPDLLSTRCQPPGASTEFPPSELFSARHCSCRRLTTRVAREE